MRKFFTKLRTLTWGKNKVVKMHRTNEEKLLLIIFFVTFNISFAHPKLLMDRDADTVLQIKQRICMSSVVKYKF